VSEVPLVSGRETVRALARIGFEVDRQRGSHIILRQSRPPHRRIVVPDHDQLAKGTLRAIWWHPGLTVREFLDLL